MTEIGVSGSFVIGIVGAGLEGIGGLAVAKLLAERADVGGVVYVAIPERFAGMTFEAFVQLDILHERAELTILHENEAEAVLVATSQVCAALYRRTRREALDMPTIRHRGQQWARADPLAVAAVFADYRRMRAWLASQYPRMFAPSDDPKATGRAKPTAQALRQWPMLRDAYAEALGITAQQANETLLHDVLRFLDNKMKRK